MANDWIFMIESKIFSIVKTKTESKIKTKFPKVTYTSSEEAITSTTVFPTIYIAELAGGTEIGKDVEATSINGILTTFEAKVLINTSKNDAKTIMTYVLNAFTDLRFQCISLPNISSLNGVYTAVARFRRPIGQADKL